MTRRIRRRAAWMISTTLLFGLWTTPVAAAPPERLEVDLFVITLDLEHELVVFWNISRDDFCAWQESDFEGPAPVTQLIEAQEHTVRGEVLMVNVAGTSSLELWSLDEDAPLTGPCEDTQDQTGPWATGSARFHGNDNDVNVSLTRTNSFGERIVGSVLDIDGNTWHFLSTLRLRIDRSGEFHVLAENFNLAPGG